MNCKLCSSHAINPQFYDREPNIDLDLCDVCYWKTRAERLIDSMRDQSKADLLNSDRMQIDPITGNVSIGKPQAEKQEPNVYGDGTVYRGVRSKDGQTKTVYYTAEKQEENKMTDDEGLLRWKGLDPKAWLVKEDGVTRLHWSEPERECEKCEPLYTAPPRDSWFKLTDAEVWDEWTRAVDESNSSNRVLAFRFARALEDKLKEKNT